MEFDAWRKDNQLRKRPDAKCNARGILINYIESGLPKSQHSICRCPGSVWQQGPSHADVERLYGEQNHMWQVLVKCKRSGQVHYQVMWQPTSMVVLHVEENRKIQCTLDDVQKVTQFGPRVAWWLKLVSWISGFMGLKAVLARTCTPSNRHSSHRRH